MIEELVISIGDIPISIKSPNNKILNQIKERYSNFIILDQNPQIELKISTNKNSSINSDNLFEFPSVDFNESYTIFTVKWRDLDSKFDITNMKGYLECSNIINFNNFLRILYSLILLKDSGFLVHSASLIKNGKGYLFPGKSGAGKTTITRLTPDSVLLSDEVSLIKRVNGEFRIFGTPFWGELAIGGENTSSPIKSVYFPVKDSENYLKKITPLNALELLIPNVLFFSESVEYREMLFNLCYEFVQILPTAELHFLQDPSFWRLIDDK